MSLAQVRERMRYAVRGVGLSWHEPIERPGDGCTVLEWRSDRRTLSVRVDEGGATYATAVARGWDEPADDSLDLDDTLLLVRLWCWVYADELATIAPEALAAMSDVEVIAAHARAHADSLALYRELGEREARRRVRADEEERAAAQWDRWQDQTERRRGGR